MKSEETDTISEQKVSVKNFSSVLPKDLLKLAEKNKVRECDETEKGHFVAYVDEGTDSYDVSLVIEGKGVVESSIM